MCRFFLIFQTPSWLEQMIQHPTWRSMIYKLADQYPDCLMLNFTIKVGFDKFVEML